MVIGTEKALPEIGFRGAPKENVEGLAGLARPRQRGVNVKVAELVHSLGTYVSHRCQELTGQLTLDDEVPRLDIAALQKAGTG